MNIQSINPENIDEHFDQYFSWIISDLEISDLEKEAHYQLMKESLSTGICKQVVLGKDVLAYFYALKPTRYSLRINTLFYEESPSEGLNLLLKYISELNLSTRFIPKSISCAEYQDFCCSKSIRRWKLGKVDSIRLIPRY